MESSGCQICARRVPNRQTPTAKIAVDTKNLLRTTLNSPQPRHLFFIFIAQNDHHGAASPQNTLQKNLSPSSPKIAVYSGLERHHPRYKVITTTVIVWNDVNLFSDTIHPNGGYSLVEKHRDRWREATTSTDSYHGPFMFLFLCNSTIHWFVSTTSNIT